MLEKNYRKIGDDGELKVIDYLTKLNFSILERNFRNKDGEIDIIAKDTDGLLRFIEVKTKINSEIEDLTYSFISRNLKNYYRLIDYYFYKNMLDLNTSCFIDLAIVNGDKILYFENVSQDFSF